MIFGWFAFFALLGLLFIAAAVLMFNAGYKPERKQKMTVHIHNHPPRQRRENVFQRVKRKQEEQRKAYHESEWKHYGNFGPW